MNSWVAVDKDGTEAIYSIKPTKRVYLCKIIQGCYKDFHKEWEGLKPFKFRNKVYAIEPMPSGVRIS